MKHKYLLILGVFLLPLGAAGNAQAAHNDYCREFTKSIRIGLQIESGYGKACLQPDGSWKIVASSGFNDPRDAFPHEIRQRIVYEPVYYAPPRRVVYYPAPYYGPRWRAAYRYHDNGNHYGHHKNNYNKHHDDHGKHKKHH